MTYMFLLFADESALAQRPAEDRAKAMDRHWDIMDDARAQGKLRDVHPLQKAATAQTVRTVGGRVAVTDGPFAETKEALGGYYLIDCDSSEEAQQWAARLAQTTEGMSVEIRAIAPIPARVRPESMEAAASSK